MALIDEKTKKRLEGVADLAKTVVQRNPVAHAIQTAKDISDAAYKIKHGKNPQYVKLVRRHLPTRKRSSYSTSMATQWERYLSKREKHPIEEDPLKRAYRLAKASGDHESARIIKRIMA